MDKKLSFRNAQRSDCELILKFIKALASYENMDNEVVLMVRF